MQMNKPFSVSQINEYIAKKLRDDFNLKNIPIEGEVSAFTKSGPHYYFTLKDNDSMIKCAIWASNLSSIDIKQIENGKKIVVLGDISPYPKGGNYSFSVRALETLGEGDLMAEFNRVKKLLENEGLFDITHKKTIPEFPIRIGAITSSTGAAIEDIKKIITSKNNLTDVIIFPTQVQGIGAVSSICDNIELANYLNNNGLNIDTLIVGRGGGSPEDLMAFNDEKVARTIFASKIPIISAVGHESDFSISDFVADKRAETPTAAADIAVMNTFELKDEVDEYLNQILQSTKCKIENERCLLSTRRELLFSYIKNIINNSQNSIEKLLLILNENNPNNILKKGFSILKDKDGNLIKSSSELRIDDKIEIKLIDGFANATITSVERN